jgi:hypothetical protein
VRNMAEQSLPSLPPSSQSKNSPKSTHLSPSSVMSTIPLSIPYSANTEPRNNRTSGCLCCQRTRYLEHRNLLEYISTQCYCLQLGSFCLSEPASGSDAFALQTRAKKDGDNWIINGSKMWITNSYEAEVFLIFANVCISSCCLSHSYLTLGHHTD